VTARCLRISVQVEKTARGEAWAHALADFDYVRAERVGLMTLDFHGVRAADERFRAWAADVCPSEDNDGWLQHTFVIAPVWADDAEPLAERGLVPGTWFLAGRATARGPSPLWGERDPARESLRVVVFNCQTAYDPMPWRSDAHWVRGFDVQRGIVTNAEVGAVVDAIRTQEAVGGEPEMARLLRRHMEEMGLSPEHAREIMTGVEQRYALLRTPTPDPRTLFPVTPMPAPCGVGEQVRLMVIREADAEAFVFLDGGVRLGAGVRPVDPQEQATADVAYAEDHAPLPGGRGTP
jgi:hypothetical protein